MLVLCTVPCHCPGVTLTIRVVVAIFGPKSLSAHPLNDLIVANGLYCVLHLKKVISEHSHTHFF